MLFRMVVGEETPDEGAVSVPKKLTIGYFRQDVEGVEGLFETFFGGFSGVDRAAQDGLLVGSHWNSFDVRLSC
jgi:ATPase subunit of ABC transporter with duplicated ATPase domains